MFGKRSIKSIIFFSRQCLVCRKYKKRNQEKIREKKYKFLFYHLVVNEKVEGILK